MNRKSKTSQASEDVDEYEYIDDVEDNEDVEDDENRRSRDDRIRATFLECLAVDSVEELLGLDEEVACRRFRSVLTQLYISDQEEYVSYVEAIFVDAFLLGMRSKAEENARGSVQIGSRQAFTLGFEPIQWRRNVDVVVFVIKLPHVPAAGSLSYVAVVAVHRVAIMEATRKL